MVPGEVPAYGQARRRVTWLAARIGAALSLVSTALMVAGYQVVLPHNGGRVELVVLGVEEGSRCRDPGAVLGQHTRS